MDVQLRAAAVAGGLACTMGIVAPAVIAAALWAAPYRGAEPILMLIVAAAFVPAWMYILQDIIRRCRRGEL